MRPASSLASPGIAPTCCARSRSSSEVQVCRSATSSTGCFEPSLIRNATSSRSSESSRAVRSASSGTESSSDDRARSSVSRCHVSRTCQRCTPGSDFRPNGRPGSPTSANSKGSDSRRRRSTTNDGGRRDAGRSPASSKRRSLSCDACNERCSTNCSSVFRFIQRHTAACAVARLSRTRAFTPAAASSRSSISPTSFRRSPSSGCQGSSRRWGTAENSRVNSQRSPRPRRRRSCSRFRTFTAAVTESSFTNS